MRVEPENAIRGNAALLGFSGQPTQSALLALLNARTNVNPSHILRVSDSDIEIQKRDLAGYGQDAF